MGQLGCVVSSFEIYQCAPDIIDRELKRVSKELDRIIDDPEDTAETIVDILNDNNNAVDVSICNKTESTIRFSVIYKTKMNSDSWLTDGWYSYSPGECNYLFSTPNKIFYVRGEEKQGSGVWTGKTQIKSCYVKNNHEFIESSKINECPNKNILKEYGTHKGNYGDFTIDFSK